MITKPISTNTEGQIHVDPALLLRGTDDQDVVEVEDDANAHCPQESRHRLGEFGEDERGCGQTEGEHEELVENPVPVESEEFAMVREDGNVEEGIFEVYGGCPVPGVEQTNHIWNALHAEVGGQGKPC